MTLCSAPLADVAVQVHGVFAKAPQTAQSCRRAWNLPRWARQSSQEKGQPETLGRRLFAGLVGLLLLASPRRSRAASGPPPPEDEIVKVIDGDTVNLKFAGRCRLIGINTPETVAPRQKEGAPPDCYGPEASALTKSLLPPGTKVKVELDVEPVDKYGRQLAYLYRSSDQLFLNAELVKQGAAKRYKVAPNVKYDTKFVELEKDAKAAGKGLWGACASKSPAGPTTSTASPGSAGSEVKDLKKRSCKDFISYEDAKAWFDKYFPQYGDIAGLDGDKDGKPCEKLLKK